MHEGRKKEIAAALFANLGITTAKFIAFAFTGSLTTLVFPTPDVYEERSA